MAVRRRFRTRNVRRTRRRFSRRLTSRRPRRTVGVVRRLSRRVARISRNFNPEFKWIDRNLNTPNMEQPSADHWWMVTASDTRAIPGEPGSLNTPVEGYLATRIFGPSQGAGPNDRNGAQCTYRNIQITGTVNCIWGDNFAPPSNINAIIAYSGDIRFYVLMDTQGTSAMVAPYFNDPVQSFFDTDIDGLFTTSSRRVPYQNQRYRVIASKKYSLNLAHRARADISINIPMKRVVHFAGVDDTTELNNHFYVVAIPSPSLDTSGWAGNMLIAPRFAVRIQARIRYVDN